MKRNSKLSLALHALGHMAADPMRPLTSAEIAAHNETNPVVVRRVLGLLRDSGLLTSDKGHHGGWTLARPAEEISLADVYIALGDRFLRPAPEGEDNPPSCQIEAALRGRVEAALNAAETVLTDRLRETTINELSCPQGPRQPSHPDRKATEAKTAANAA